MLKIKQRNIILWSIIFRSLIDIVYITIISKHFARFALEINYKKYILSWLLFILSLMIIEKIISKKHTKTSVLICYIVYFINYIPTISLWALANFPNAFFIYVNIYWYMILIFMLCYSHISIRPVKLHIDSRVSKILLYIIFILFAFFAIFFSYKYNDLKLHFSLLDVYDLRFKARNYDIGTIMNILYRCASTLVFPLYAITFLIKRKWLLFIFVCYLQLLMFSIAGHKFFFFIIPVAVLAYFFYDDKYLKLIPKIFSIMVGVSFIEKAFFNTYYIASFFVRRMMYVPALLNYYYYDFFKSNPPIFFSTDMILSQTGLVKSPYKIPIPRLIASYYYNSPETNANTGMLGDAFANLGVYGVIIFPIIFFVFLVLIDIITYKVPKKYFIGVIVSMIVALTNGKLNGILYFYIVPLTPLLILLYNTMKNKEQQKKLALESFRIYK